MDFFKFILKLNLLMVYNDEIFILSIFFIGGIVDIVVFEVKKKWRYYRIVLIE